MNETSKAMRRRWVEDEQRIFPWKTIFRGRGLDIGAGDDPLSAILPDCVTFDREGADVCGDANELHNYLPGQRFDYIHASQVLEHMVDVPEALSSWLSLLAPGGHLVVTVPSWELYEHKRERSIWNPDHKATFSTLNRTGGGVLPHFFVPDFPSNAIPGNYSVILCRLLAENYDFSKWGTVDQTLDPTAGVEPWIEFVIKRCE